MIANPTMQAVILPESFQPVFSPMKTFAPASTPPIAVPLKSARIVSSGSPRSPAPVMTRSILVARATLLTADRLRRDGDVIDKDGGAAGAGHGVDADVEADVAA